MSGKAVDKIMLTPLELEKNVTKDEINQLFKSKQSDFIKYTNDPVVSSDILGARCGSLVDGLSTKVLQVEDKQLIKIVSWYDNEMSYTSQMIKTMKVLLNK